MHKIRELRVRQLRLFHDLDIQNPGSSGSIKVVLNIRKVINLVVQARHRKHGVSCRMGGIQ